MAETCYLCISSQCGTTVSAQRCHEVTAQQLYAAAGDNNVPYAPLARGRSFRCTSFAMTHCQKSEEGVNKLAGSPPGAPVCSLTRLDRYWLFCINFCCVNKAGASTIHRDGVTKKMTRDSRKWNSTAVSKSCPQPKDGCFTKRPLTPTSSPTKIPQV